MRLYLETSLFSFWFDPQPRNREKRRDVRRLLLACRRGTHQGYISAVVVDELDVSDEPFRSRDLGLLRKLGPATVTAHREPFDRLLGAYEKDPRLSKIPVRDREHIALYSLSDLDGLATMNLKDFTRPVILEAVEKVNHAQGIAKTPRLGSPASFLPPPQRRGRPRAHP